MYVIKNGFKQFYFAYYYYLINVDQMTFKYRVLYWIHTNNLQFESNGLLLCICVVRVFHQLCDQAVAIHCKQ